MSYFNLPNGMSNEDLEYFDSPDEERRMCEDCGCLLNQADPLDFCEDCRRK
jgi:hypothetical protein